jgi:hypothetical protein
MYGHRSKRKAASEATCQACAIFSDQWLNIKARLSSCFTQGLLDGDATMMKNSNQAQGGKSKGQQNAGLCAPSSLEQCRRVHPESSQD